MHILTRVRAALEGVSFFLTALTVAEANTLELLIFDL